MEEKNLHNLTREAKTSLFYIRTDISIKRIKHRLMLLLGREVRYFGMASDYKKEFPLSAPKIVKSLMTSPSMYFPFSKK